MLTWWKKAKAAGAKVETDEKIELTVPHDDFLALLRTRYLVPEGFSARILSHNRRYDNGAWNDGEIWMTFERRCDPARFGE